MFSRHSCVALPRCSKAARADCSVAVLQVMSRVPLTLAPIGGPVHMTHVRGYLFLAAPTGVAVFNTSGFSNRRAPRMILAHAYSNVASAFAPEDMVGLSLQLAVHTT